MYQQTKTQAEVIEQFTAYYRDDFKRLTYFVVRLGASVEEAQDVAQEAMKEAMRSWPEIDHPHAFVRKAATRIFLRDRQKIKRVHEAALRDGAHDMTATFDTDTEYILQMLNALPTEQREVMAWTLDGYTPTEIAEMTGQKAATVRSHLRHAREKLIKKLDQQHKKATRKEASDGP
jgi:RNA polymerase sigma factor (sigma-70 family)